jgi:hypothetical protein
MQWTTFAALALLPIGIFVLRVVSRCIVEIAYQLSPKGWFRELLARDRRRRTSRR